MGTKAIVGLVNHVIGNTKDKNYEQLKGWNYKITGVTKACNSDKIMKIEKETQ